jgi:GntR family transcriptional regulator/MocR family aminotransferase
MLTYSFEDIGKVSLYEHLYKCIKADIISGKIKPNEKLPSKRAFAKNLGISVITVENSYEQLIAEGFVYSAEKKGYYAADISSFNAPTEFFSSASSASEGRESSFSSNTKDNDVSQYSSLLADFSSNETSPENFPFTTWAKISRSVLLEKQTELLTNSPSGGVYELREAIASYLKAFRGITAGPEQIIIGAGTEYLYSLIIQLIGFDKLYAMEDPGYSKLSKIYERYGIKYVNIPIDKNGMTEAGLRKANADCVHITPSHHFPTGITMPITRRMELLKWAIDGKDRYIIEDDYDSEFRMSGLPLPALRSIDKTGRVIYINTFNKSLSSTMRVSYMVLPESLLKSFNEKLGFYSCSVSNFIQYSLAAFIENGHLDHHISRMRTYYHAKRDALLKKIKNSPLSKYVTIIEQNSGLHFLMHINTELSDKEFCSAALKNGVKLLPVSDYYSSSSAKYPVLFNTFENTEKKRAEKNTLQRGNIKHIYIINYSSLKDEAIDKSLDAILRAIIKPS